MFVAVQQRRTRDAGAVLSATLNAVLAMPADSDEAAWCVDMVVGECERQCVAAVAGEQRGALARLLGVVAGCGLLYHPRCTTRLRDIEANLSAVGREGAVPLAFVLKRPAELVEALVAQRKFAAALCVAQKCGLDCSAVLFSQAAHMVDVHRQQACVWWDERERVALWNRISMLFVAHRVEPRSRQCQSNSRRSSSSRQGANAREAGAASDRVLLVCRQASKACASWSTACW